MSLTQYTLDLLNTYPGLTAGEIHVDMVQENPVNFSIQPEPVTPVVKKYRGGDSIRLFSFQLMARQYTTSDTERIFNATLYEDLSMWLETQSRGRLLPDMGEARTAQKIEAVGSGYLQEREEDANTAIYTMQIQLKYYQKGGFAQ